MPLVVDFDLNVKILRGKAFSLLWVVISID